MTCRELVWFDHFGTAEIAWDIAHVLTLNFQHMSLLVDSLLLLLVLLQRLRGSMVLHGVMLMLRVLMMEGATKGLILLRLMLLLLLVSRKWSRRGRVESKCALSERIVVG